MILVEVILFTLAIGVLGGRSLSRLGELRFQWGAIVLVCLLGQLAVITLPVTSPLLVNVRVAGLVVTQLALVGVAFANRRLPGVPVILVGTVLNAAVMLANGGLMPITPEVAQIVRPSLDISARPLGAPLSASKDVLLRREDTVLWELSDRFVTPPIPFRSAFSLGDAVIAVGVVWLLWQATAPVAGSIQQRKRQPAAVVE